MSSSPTAPQGADTISTVPTPRAGSTGTEAPARPAASFGDGLPGDLREGYADIGDVQLHYVEAGEGPLVVLLHGFPEFWYGWGLQIQPLAAAGFRVVAPDMRGYNLSSRPEDVAAYDSGRVAGGLPGVGAETGGGTALR